MEPKARAHAGRLKQPRTLRGTLLHNAQATEPGSCPLELIDSPEPEFTVTAHGDGSVGNSFIAIDFKNCYTNEPSNTTGQPFMPPGSRRFSTASPGDIQPLILNSRVPSANEVASMEGTNDSILTSQVKSKLFRVGRMNSRHMNAPTKNINSMYEHQMSDAQRAQDSDLHERKTCQEQCDSTADSKQVGDERPHHQRNGPNARPWW